MEHLKEGYILAGRYRIDRFIGRGGFSCTYVATDLKGDGNGEIKVAVKEMIIRDFSTRGADGVTVVTVNSSRHPVVERVMGKFLEEAQFLQSISSPDIVHVSDYFRANNTAYYVMDYIDGESLADMVKRGSLTEKAAVGYINQVAEALKVVHGLNRLHLDVKPANIMVDRDGNAILIDFGTSKQYDAENGENHSTLLGKTLNYAAIEQCGNAVEHFHAATDIYALGATLYKLLTGVTPPGAVDRVTGKVLPPLPPTVSPNTAKGVMKAMEIRREDRPQTIDEFLDLLRGVESAPALEDDDELEVTVLTTVNNEEVDSESTVIGTTKPVDKNTENRALLDLSNAAHADKKSVLSMGAGTQNPAMRWVAIGVIAAVVAVLVTCTVLYFTDSKPKSSSTPSTATTTTSTSTSSSSADAGGDAQINDADREVLQTYLGHFNSFFADREVARGMSCRDIELHGRTIVFNLVISNNIRLTDKDMAEFKNEFVPQFARGFMMAASQNGEFVALIKRNNMDARVNAYQDGKLLAYGIASLSDL